MSALLGTPERPLRVAIVGAGPSGFYAAEALFASSIKIEVDMYDRLPAPFGLVRYGVAPDHPKIKNVIKVYEKTAGHPQFAFFGNVMIGKDIALEELQRYYDAIIFTCGAQTDRSLGIPGEDLPGSYTATEFVAWYNGHPEYRDRTFDLSHEVAVIVGQGNVAMDVGRILCKTVDELKNTDIAQYALKALAESQVKEVHLIGRRGPIQAAFTPPEIKEFGELKDCDPVLDPAYLNLNPESQMELEDPNHAARKKNWEVLQEFVRRGAPTKKKKFIIHFYKGPKELCGNGHVEKVILEKNKLVGPAGAQQAVGTGQVEELPCGVFFRSVGYRGVSIPGVPFDTKKGVFLNVAGRIVEPQGAPSFSPMGRNPERGSAAPPLAGQEAGPSRRAENDKVIPGLYASGWIKRGPSGVIGTNKPDSVQTVQNLLSDAANLPGCPMPQRAAVIDFLRRKDVKFVSFDDWKKIDSAEIERGKPLGKPREKFIKVEEMLAVLQ